MTTPLWKTLKKKCHKNSSSCSRIFQKVKVIADHIAEDETLKAHGHNTPSTVTFEDQLTSITIIVAQVKLDAEKVAINTANVKSFIEKMFLAAEKSHEDRKEHLYNNVEALTVKEVLLIVKEKYSNHNLIDWIHNFKNSKENQIEEIQSSIVSKH